MKKLLILLQVFLFAILFVACSKENEEKTNYGSNSIIGTWCNYEHETEGDEWKITFNADGTFSERFRYDDEAPFWYSGLYEYEAPYLKTYYYEDNNGVGVYQDEPIIYNIEILGNRMILSYYGYEEDGTMTFYREN